MTIKERINRQMLGLEVLEGIEYFETRIKLTKESINGFAGTFPELNKKYEHNLIIFDMCIKRLNQRYNKIMSYGK